MEIKSRIVILGFSLFVILFGSWLFYGAYVGKLIIPDFCCLKIAWFFTSSVLVFMGIAILFLIVAEWRYSYLVQKSESP